MAKRSKPLKAPDKLVFLLSFVPYLLERRVVDVAEAAQHFGMTEEEIRDAVRLIATSGLPGSTGTYQPNDLFDIDWDSFEDDDVIVIVHHVAIDDAPRLSAREAAALMAGLQYLSASPESAGSASLASLRAKLAAGASSAPSRLGGRRDGGRRVARAHPRGRRRGPSARVRLPECRGERGRRRADPLRIISQDADWYLQAYCHTREDVRNFRVDRMSDLLLTDEPIGDHSHRIVPDTLFQGSDSDLDVVVDVSPAPFRCSPTTSRTRAPARSTGDSGSRSALAHVHGLKRLVGGAAWPGHRGRAPRGARCGGGLGERRAGGYSERRTVETGRDRPSRRRPGLTRTRAGHLVGVVCCPDR